LKRFFPVARSIVYGGLHEGVAVAGTAVVAVARAGGVAAAGSGA